MPSRKFSGTDLRRRRFDSLHGKGGGVKDLPDEVVGGIKLAIRYLDCGKKGKKIQPLSVSRGSLYHNNTPLLGNLAPKVLGGEGLEVGRCQENASTSPQGSTKTVKA